MEHVSFGNGDPKCPAGVEESAVQEEQLIAATGPWGFTAGKAPIKQTKQKKRRKVRKAKKRSSEEPDSIVLTGDSGVSFMQNLCDVQRDKQLEPCVLA